jgi:signal transduction histidine kinase
VHRSDPDPFKAPLVPLGQYRQFNPEGISLHRLRVRGVVTHGTARGDLFLEEGGRAIRVIPLRPEPRSIGERVEVSGFFIMRTFFSQMEGARVRALGETAVIAPPLVSPREIAEGDFDARLVQLRGVLRKSGQLADDVRLYLETDNQLIETRLPLDAAGNHEWREGSLLEVTGLVESRLLRGRGTDGSPKFSGFSLLLRSPSDIRVLRAPSWLTPRRLGWGVAVLAASLLCILGWNKLLHRRVQERSMQLAREIQSSTQAHVEYEATLRERNRLAADLHDSVAQGFTAVAFQLEAARAYRPVDHERAEEHLRLAGQMLEHSRDDLRRSVWDLKARMLEGRSLAEALHEFVRQSRRPNGPRLEVDTSAAETRVPDFIASNLFLCAQEAVSNALEHAHASDITIRLAIDSAAIRLAVTDDGRGFANGHVSGPAQGHFGLSGMHERAVRLGGKLRVSTGPCGTTVEAVVPWESKRASSAG